MVSWRIWKEDIYYEQYKNLIEVVDTSDTKIMLVFLFILFNNNYNINIIQYTIIYNYEILKKAINEMFTFEFYQNLPPLLYANILETFEKYKFILHDYRLIKII